MEVQDTYEETASQQSVMYITENISTKETEGLFNEMFAGGCECLDSCIGTTCGCLRNQGANYIVGKDAAFVLNPERRPHGFYECNDNCKCFPRKCGNRLAQFGPRNHLQVISCSEKGKGLITTQSIADGEFICEYAGEVLSQMEARRRFQHNEANKCMNYIICIREYFHESETRVQTYIDPCYFGNVGRFLNHSCVPNCFLLPIRVNNSVPKLGIFAKCAIAQNCELTFDYSDGTVMTCNDANVQLKRCLCGENSCRKWLPYSGDIV